MELSNLSHIKRAVLSGILIFSVCLPNASAYMSKGDKAYIFNSQYCIDNGGDSVNDSSISVTDGSGEVTYNFYLPFDCQSVTVNYECNADAALQVGIGDNVHNVDLKKDNATITSKFKKVIRKGEMTVKLKITGNIDISKITFDKAELPGNSIDAYPLMTEATDYQKAIQGAVMVDTNAAALIVRGQRRYIDNENIRKTPVEIDGTIYLPAKTLALALGYYCENLPEKSYLLMRKGNTEYVFLEGVSYKQAAYEDKTEIGCYLKYIDGEAYLPLRYFAEETGKAIGYNDGLIVIDDDRFEVSNIINNYNKEVRAAFEPFYPTESAGKTYYVSKAPGASDANDGSYDFPFKSLAQAGKTAKAGDTVIIREGVYRETFTPKNDGTALNPVTFKAMEGEEVVISALEEINSFAPYKDDIYTANIGWDLGDGRNMVFYNGEALAEARYPNGPAIEMSETGEALSDLFPIKGDMHTVSENNSKTVTSDTLLDQPDNYWQGGTVVSMHGMGWTLSTGKILSSEKGKLTVGDTAQQWWYAATAADKQNYAFITSHINAMDIPGEWVMQNKALLIIPPEGADPSEMKLEIKKRQLVIDIADRKYVRLEGIKTIGGGVRMNNSEMCTIDGCELKYISHYIHGYDQREGYIYTGNRSNPDDAPQRGEVGIYVGGTDNIIINSTIDHSAAAGILLVGTYAYIENNTVSNCGYAGSYISGITFGNEVYKGVNIRKGGFTLYNNTVYNSGRSVLNIQNPDGNDYCPVIPYETAYNDFHDGVLFSLDTGITYEFHVYSKTDKQESSMHNNYVYYTGKKTNPYSFAIYHDGGAVGIDTYENMVFTTEPGVIFSQLYVQNSAKDMNIWNNGQIKLAIGGGPEKLDADEFPYGRPFYAGAKKADSEYLINYSRIKENTPQAEFYKVSAAELSDGVSIDNEGCAVFSGNNQYICFKDVDFGDGGNNINILYRADKYNTNDCIDVYVGNSLETATSYNNNYVYSFSKTEQHDNLFSLGIEPVVGKTNIYIKKVVNKSLRIKGISVNDSGKPIEAHDGEKVYGGAYNNVERTGSAAPSPIGGPDQIHSYVKDTWNGTILRYNNVTIKEPATVLQYSAASTPDHGDQYITIAYNKRGDPDNTEIAAIYSATEGFSVFNTYYVPLEHTLQPGVYDIYVSFGEKRTILNGSSNGTCNFWFFGFLPEMPTE